MLVESLLCESMLSRLRGLLGIRDSTERGVGKTGERKSNEIRIVYLAEVHLRLYFGSSLLLLFVESEHEGIHLLGVLFLSWKERV